MKMVAHMDLQAIRYAAMISTLSFSQAVAVHARFIKADAIEAEFGNTRFPRCSEPPEDFGQAVRIILVSPDFSRELTTAVLWLNTNGLNIRCVRLRPYKLDERTLLEVDQVIPYRRRRHIPSVSRKSKKRRGRPPNQLLISRAMT